MHRSSLNRECRLLHRGNLSPIDILVFSVAKERCEGGDEWEGFVTTIKSFIAKSRLSVQDKITKELQSKMTAH